MDKIKRHREKAMDGEGERWKENGAKWPNKINNETIETFNGIC